MPPESSTPGLAEFLGAHATLLAWLHAQANADRWGISCDEFSTVLYGCACNRYAGALPGHDLVEAHLRALHLEDLALACALRKGSEAAWQEFFARFRPILYGAARAIVGPAGDARARELADSLYAELYGLGGSRRHSLLDYFHGRSKLATWLRTVLAQRHVDALRAAKRIDSLDEHREGQRPAAVASRTGTFEADDPDRSRLLPRLREAMGQALASLAPADRLLLSLYYVQELTLAQVARLRGVHEATVSRQIDRIRRELREGVARSLAAGSAGPDGRVAATGLSPAEIQLCFSYALDDWAFDLASALSGGSGKASYKTSYKGS